MQKRHKIVDKYKILAYNNRKWNIRVCHYKRKKQRARCPYE